MVEGFSTHESETSLDIVLFTFEGDWGSFVVE
jgi:hypothetical protein